MASPQQTVRLLMGVFGGIGAILLAIAAYVTVDAWRWKAHAARAEGVVTDLVWTRSDKGSSTAAPLVQFTAEGKTVEIKGGLSSSPPSYARGDRVTVLYTPGRPEDGEIEGFFQQYLVTVILTGLGVPFAAVPVVIAIVIARGRLRRARALAYGQSVRAKVKDVRQDTSVQVNGRSPWVIVAEYKSASSAEPLRFESERLWSDPGGQYPIGSEVAVFYMPTDPTCCAFKLDKLEKAE